MPYDDKEFLKEGDAGYAEAKAKREARWTAREAELKNVAHVDKGEGVKAEILTDNSPTFKTRIGKKIADTLTKAGDKAEDLRAKKNYLSSQVQRITGKPKSKQKLAGKPGYSPGNRVFKPVMRQPKIISTRETGRSSSSFMNDFISGAPHQSKSTSQHIGEMVGGNSNSNNANTSNLIFGSGGKKGKKGKKNDPFGGLLG